MDKLRAALKDNDLRGFLLAVLEEAGDMLVPPDEHQEMLDYCLAAENAPPRVRAFVIGINEYKKTYKLSPKQKQCIKSTYDSLKLLEKQTTLFGDGSDG